MSSARLDLREDRENDRDGRCAMGSWVLARRTAYLGEGLRWRWVWTFSFGPEKREGTGKILNKGGNKYIQPEKQGTYTIFQTTKK